jgi:hypothetical protein
MFRRLILLGIDKDRYHLPSIVPLSLCRFHCAAFIVPLSAALSIIKKVLNWRVCAANHPSPMNISGPSENHE